MNASKQTKRERERVKIESERRIKNIVSIRVEKSVSERSSFHRLCYCYRAAATATATVIVVISIHPFNLFTDSFIHSFIPIPQSAHCIIFSFKVNLLQKYIYRLLLLRRIINDDGMENLCHRIVHR